ncbi:MAG: cell division protein ZapA [Gemmatimonadota bacterium]|jgi:cell division protein ZapA (FtsZ GTPase activity inhibitor)
MTEKQSVSVRIAGEEHIIRASAEPDYTRRCAGYVDDRIMEIRTKAGLLETHKAAILAALSITDELLQTQKELHRLREDISRQAGDLARRLEAGLDSGDRR